MTDIARFTVIRAGPLTSIQAGPRSGYRRFGVPPSGPIDPIAHAACNAALGNRHDAAVIETSLGGLTLRCDAGEAALAWTGGDMTGAVDGRFLGAWHAMSIHAGQTLTLRSASEGNWAYLGFGGALDASTWLGSASTHRLSGLGGGSLIDGQLLTVTARSCVAAGGAIPAPPAGSADCLSIVLGPQDRHFDPRAIATFLAAPIEATAQFDRMGMVLKGDVPASAALGLISEPAIGGAIQIDGSGRAVLLLADHQTTGGYPKLGVLGWRDTIALAQARPKRQFHLREVSAEQAVEEGRTARAEVRRYLAELSGNTGSLADRLASGNLISGAVSVVSEA